MTQQEIDKLVERDVLLQEYCFNMELWRTTLEDADLKDIDAAILTAWGDYRKRIEVLHLLVDGKLFLGIPHMIQIPKDTPGEFRICKVGTPDERILCAFFNNCLFKHFKHMVHPTCKSYQKGLSTADSVKECSKAIVKMATNVVGVKVDYHAYFDTVLREVVFSVFDSIEKQMGFKKLEEPVMNFFRIIFANDKIIDLDRNEIEEWSGIRQGNPVSAFLADVVLYDVDVYMSEKYPYYIRYSDDSIILTDRPSEAIHDLERLTSKYGVSLNAKKTEIIYSTRYVKFLGFEIMGEHITISKRRLNDFVKEIRSRTIDNPRATFLSALKSVMTFLYGHPNSKDGYSWATSIFGAMNVIEDLQEMNKFVLDCLKAMITDKKDIASPGFEPHKLRKVDGKTVARLGVVTYSPASGGTGGKNVGKNMKRVRVINGYVSLLKAYNDFHLSKYVYQATIRLAWLKMNKENAA